MTWYGDKSPSKISPKDPSVIEPFLLSLGSAGAKLYSSAEDGEILNFQRGLASLFIIKRENLEIEETDVLGKCNTRYHIDRHGFHKIKEFCQSGQEDQSNLFDNRKYSIVTYLYKLQENTDIIDSLEVKEYLQLSPNLTPEIAQDLQQRQVMTLKGKNSSIFFSIFFQQS